MRAVHKTAYSMKGVALLDELHKWLHIFNYNLWQEMKKNNAKSLKWIFKVSSAMGVFTANKPVS